MHFRNLETAGKTDISILDCFYSPLCSKQTYSRFRPQGCSLCNSTLNSFGSCILVTWKAVAEDIKMVQPEHPCLCLVARLLGGTASPVVKKAKRNGSWQVMLSLIRTLGDWTDIQTNMLDFTGQTVNNFKKRKKKEKKIIGRHIGKYFWQRNHCCF